MDRLLLGSVLVHQFGAGLLVICIHWTDMNEPELLSWLDCFRSLLGRTRSHSGHERTGWIVAQIAQSCRVPQTQQWVGVFGRAQGLSRVPRAGIRWVPPTRTCNRTARNWEERDLCHSQANARDIFNLRFTMLLT